MSETDNDLRELYQDMILDHGKRPRNFHVIDPADCEAVGHNPLCGDKLVLFLRVGEDGRIADAAFQGTGCAISVASASMMTEMLKGKTAAEAKKLWAYFEAVCKSNATPADMTEGLAEDDIDRLQALSGVRHYPVRVKCATLAWRTLESALDPKAVKKVATE
ncbi:MAG: SUF system NifU family Fe-S cluster assembly protein [Alphaproteobacteria bacterium]|nr:SUF system NifU family Fe-S cluster assembly protein [Alphaproteobacteria bacterium]